jgi:hypothetical protein
MRLTRESAKGPEVLPAIKGPVLTRARLTGPHALDPAVKF